jgi:putative FmdB family regulatory protein
MRTYTYKCKLCSYIYEYRMNVDDSPPRCEKCDGESRRVITLTPVVYRGKGFYNTDKSR